MIKQTPWPIVKASLIERGFMTEGGLTRSARARQCPGCSMPVLAGLDDDRCAAEVRCDPTPVNAMGEAMALMAGRRTYSLHWAGGRYTIDLRDSFNITAHPAGSDFSFEVIATHICGQAMPMQFHGSVTVGPPIRKQASHDDTPPF